MAFWIIVIILLTVSMILTYYLIPGSPEPMMAHAYVILLISLAVLYRIYRKTRSRHTEKLIEELNYLRMRVAQLEGQFSENEQLETQESGL